MFLYAYLLFSHLLNPIVTVVMMLCVRQHHVMRLSQCCKVLKNVECKFYKYFWLEQYCM